MTGDAPFLAAQTGGDTWQEAAGLVLRQLAKAGPAHRLGIIYVSPHFADNLNEIEILLRQSTGIPHWIGTIGYGTVGLGLDGHLEEAFGSPSLSVLACPFEERDFRVFSGVRGKSDPVSQTYADWLGGDIPPVVIAHGDPGNGLLGGLIEDVAEETDGCLLGGFSVAQGPGSQIADGPDGQGLSGALLSLDRIPLQPALSQGCSPIGKVHIVTSCEEHVIFELDNHAALQVFKEDIGEVLARDLNRCTGYIFAGLPVEGSDSGDYTVRNLLAIDPEHDALAIAAHMMPGDPILFCRRDPANAVDDMRRMLKDLKARIGDAPVRGGLYVTCAARGPNHFSDPNRETQLIAETFGHFPLTGFFANGEFNRDRIYAYTGVLTLFL